MAGQIRRVDASSCQLEVVHLPAIDQLHRQDNSSVSEVLSGLFDAVNESSFSVLPIRHRAIY